MAPDMPAADERQLIRQAVEGRNGAFRMLVERHMRKAYDIAFHHLGNHEDAEDVSQEAFVRVYRSLHSFRGDSAFDTWLYRIVTNLSMNKLRQRASRAKREVPPDPGISDRTGERDVPRDIPVEPEFMHMNPDMRGHIETALHELPTVQRAVVILRHMDGLSTRQVSKILKCSEGTVKTHLHRGLKKMRKLLDYTRKD
jgi:RNA polymerase sigma-70 factor (ECF subfamily)